MKRPPGSTLQAPIFRTVAVASALSVEPHRNTFASRFAPSRLRGRIAVCALALLFVATARADLKSDVSAILRDKALAKGETSVQLARLDSNSAKPEVLFGHNSDIALLPASNLKLITTSAFLDHFGADFRFRTMLAHRSADGDLVLIGDGDPTVGDAEMLKKVGWESTTLFANWAEMLKKRGITSVRNIVVDDGVFDEEFVHPSWPVKQQHFRYVAGVGGLNFNANALDFYLRTGAFGSPVSYTTDPPTRYANVGNACLSGGENAVWLSRAPGTNNIDLKGQTNSSNTVPISVSIHDPPMYAGTVLAETLRAAGVKFTGAVVRDRTARAALVGEGKRAPALAAATQPDSAAPLTVLAIHETPISVVLARANKDSVNLYAEAMCKRLGADLAQEPGSWKNGTAAVTEFVRRCFGGAGSGPTGDFNIDDGSGLSRKNAVSSAAIVRVLSHQFATPNRDAFVTSLSVAGVDGTLDNRFRDSDLRGRVFAKSGFVNGVSGLSGLMRSRDGRQWYAFSILMNGVSDIATCKQLQERIVKALDAQATGSSSAAQPNVTSAR